MKHAPSISVLVTSVGFESYQKSLPKKHRVLANSQTTINIWNSSSAHSTFSKSPISSLQFTLLRVLAEETQMSSFLHQEQRLDTDTYSPKAEIVKSVGEPHK